MLNMNIKEILHSAWYDLKPHPVQLDLVGDKVRFKLVPAGRRSGKTERAKRFVVKSAFEVVGDYFVAAPTRDQVKRIYWKDLKELCFIKLLGKKIAKESELIIYLPNGSTITLIGLDQPSRIEGKAWKGGVVDEIANVKEDAWNLNIYPALQSFNPKDPDYRPWCWLIGVPEGFNHYYDMVQYGLTANDPDWKVYTWHSSDILPDDVIKSAKMSMSSKQYRQEFEASFETTEGRIYEDYSSRNYSSEVLSPDEPILWAHDFNFTPMSSVVVSLRGDKIYCVDEIILSSAVARQSALEFVDKYLTHKNKTVTIYGDPAGRAGEKHGHASDYTEMEKVLRSAGWKVERKVKLSAPAIRDRQNAVRKMILSASDEVTLFVNVQRCPYMHKGFSTAQTMKGSAFMEEQTEYQHITTAIGYLVDYEFPIRRDLLASTGFIPPTVNYFKDL